MTEQTIKDNTDKFLSPDYLNMVEAVVHNIITENDQLNALDLVKLFTDALSQESIKLKITKDYLNFYNKNIIKLKFIALPLLDDGEVISLLENNFTDQFQIEDYKLLEKFNYKLLNTILVSDRDNLKIKLVNGLLKSQEIIVKYGEIKKICDWLKNYIIFIGQEENDSLLKAQYIASLKSNNKINPIDRSNLMVLFQFYDLLKIHSDSPDGLLEEPPVVINGKLFVFRKGILDPVPEKKELDMASRLLFNKNLSNNPNSSDDLFLPEKPKSQSTLTQSNIQSEIAPLSPLEELEQSLKNYSESSFEYKALRQEISRLKKSELTKAQYADVKK